ncbi:MAG: prohibitin family protein [Flavobacteriales bacterium]|nr:prohibitin family protein [Flavobacteriales bacterium]
MKNHKIALSGIVLLFVTFILSSCAVIRPGEVGVKQRLGKLTSKIHESGTVGINPFTTTLIRIPTRTVNLEVNLNLPSKEGLNVLSEISILYHIKPEKAIAVIEEVGLDYEEVVILSVFRSAAADVCAQYLAKDMHSGNRSDIEASILKRMDDLLGERGFEIEAVLLKSISLPDGLYTAIEDKLRAEQEALRMEFVLQLERQEAERKKIEAEGTRDAQLILTEGLNDQIIKLRSLEVLRDLANSPNAKLIITDGKAPVLLGEEGTE